MYLSLFRLLVLESNRWGGLRRVGSMEWKTELISMSRKMAGWSEGVTESNGSMAPRLIARSRSELAKDVVNGFGSTGVGGTGIRSV